MTVEYENIDSDYCILFSKVITMGFFTLILAIGLGFGALFLLLLLYFLCRSCDQQNRTVDEYRYKQPPSHQTVPRRSHQSLPRSSQPSHPERHNSHPQPNFPKKLDHRLRRHEIVDVENDDDLQLRTWKPEKKNVENVFYINEVKRPSRSLLTKAAIEKHVDPNCETDMDAVRISEERSRKYTKTWCNVNHVFKVQPSDFKEVYMPKIRMQVIYFFRSYMYL